MSFGSTNDEFQEAKFTSLTTKDKTNPGSSQSLCVKVPNLVFDGCNSCAIETVA